MQGFFKEYYIVDLCEELDKSNICLAIKLDNFFNVI